MSAERKDSPADFHVLRERLRLKAVLKSRTGLHIGGGSGLEANEGDMPVLRDARGLPFIPGSSLKGVVRSTVESLVRAIPKHPAVWACDPLEESEERGACGYHESGNRAAAAEMVERSCAVCRLFGSRLLASHVRFTDALIHEYPEGTPPPIETRDGVAIDRDLKVVHGKQKYDFEVVSPGTKFEVELFVENPRPWTMGLLVVGLEQVAEGFTALGGFSSRGLGRVEIEWQELSRISAESALRGDPAETLQREKEFEAWRRALAKKLDVPGEEA